MAQKFSAGSVKSKITGGSKIRSFLKKAKTAQASGMKTVNVGFFESAKYPDGTPVAAVAAWNEFGTKTQSGKQNIPERPFFRNAIPEMAKGLQAVAIKHVKPSTMAVKNQTARLMGDVCKAKLQESITDLKTPPNAPETIRRKKGSTNPLINEGFMRMSASYEVGKKKSD